MIKGLLPLLAKAKPYKSRSDNLPANSLRYPITNLNRANRHGLELEEDLDHRVQCGCHRARYLLNSRLALNSKRSSKTIYSPPHRNLRVLRAASASVARTR